MMHRAFVVVLTILASSSMAAGQVPPPAPPDTEAIHQELRALRDQLIDAVQKRDIDRMLSFVSENAVVTWQNAEVCRGHKGLREFFERTGKNTFKTYKVPPTPDELTILYGGDTGVVFGHDVGVYSLYGREVEMPNRWTATVVRENGRWLVASYHVSTNVLDNPLLPSAKKSVYLVGGTALIVGLAVGLLFGRRRRNRQ